MKNHDGALSFEAYINQADWNKSIRSMNQDVNNLTKNTLSQTEKMGLGFRNFSTVAASALAGMGLAMLPGQIVKIRGEFQQLEIALNTMLGSKAKADKMMGEIVQFAAQTPYGLKDTAEASKMLLAYGAQADTVIETMRRLGDIASGIGAPLKDIAYLYGTTMTQGRLYTQDLNQFLGRGIPMLRELAKIFGVAESEVKGLVEAGKVGFPEVQKVIENLTNSGSMFGGLMEAQSKSLVGLQAQLGDALDAMFNDIGQKQEGLLSDIFKGTISIVENYEKVIDVLTVLVATYGAYRAALILTAVAQVSTGIAANARLWFDLAKSIKSAADAQALFNLTTRANPYVIAATALAALVTGYVLFNKEATTAQKIQKGFSDATKKTEESLASEQARILSLKTQIQNETNSRKERIKALQDLIQISPEHLGALSLENIATDKGTQAINSYIEAKRKQIELKEIESQLEASINRQNSAKRNENDISYFDKVGLSMASIGSNGQMDYGKLVAQERKKANDEALKQEDEIQAKLRERIEVLSGVSNAENNSAAETEKITRKTVSWYDEEISALKKKQEANSEDHKSFIEYQKQINNLEKQRDAITGGKNKVTEKDKPQPFGSLAYWEQVSSKANEVLNKTPLSNTQALQKQQSIIIDAEKRIAEIRKSIAVKSFEEEIAEKQKQYELYERWVQHMGEDAAKAQFSTLLANGSSFSDYLQSQINSITTKGLSSGYSEEEVKNLDSLKTLLNDFTGTETPIQRFEKSLDDARDSAGSLTEEILKLKEIQSELNPTDTSSAGYEKRSLVQQRLIEAQKERKYLLNEFLSEVVGSEQRRIAIETRFSDLRNDLNERNADRKSEAYLKALERINEAEKKALQEDSTEAIINSKSYKELEHALTLTKRNDTGKRLELLKSQLSQLVKGTDEYIAKLREVKEAELDHKKYALEGWATIASIVGELGSALEGYEGKLGQIGGALSGLASAANRVSTTFANMDNFKTSEGKLSMEGYAAAAQNLISIITGIIGANQKRIQEERQFAAERLGFENDYALQLNQSLGDNYKNNPFFKDYEGMIKAGVDQYEDAFNKYQAAIDKLEEGKVKERQKNVVDGKTTLGMVGSGAAAGAMIGTAIGGWAMGIGTVVGTIVGGVVGLVGGLFSKKKKDVYGSLLEQYPELVTETAEGWAELNIEMAKALITNNQVDDSTRTMLENAIALNEEMQKAKQQIQDSMVELTGQVGDNLRNALVEAFRAGDSAAQALHKTVGGIIADITSKLLFSSLVGPVLDQLVDEMTNSLTSGDGSIVDDLVRFDKYGLPAVESYFDGLSQLEEWAKNNGFDDIFGRSQGVESAMQGSIKGMSEETASVLVGQFNAVRIYQAEMNANIRITVLQLQSIAENTAFNRYLVRLEAIENHLASISRGQNIRGSGL